jgi:hypothetical protein
MVAKQERCWRELTIDVSGAVRKDIDFGGMRAKSDFRSKPIGIWNFADDEITDLLCADWVEHFASLGFDIKNVLIFYRQPGFQASTVHIDMQGSVNPVPAVCALNWLTDATPDSKMVWYDLPKDRDGHLYTDSEYGLDNNYAASWPLDRFQGNEIDSCLIGDKLTLVKTGLPHSIIMGKRPRWCISLRLHRHYHIQTWSDALDLFQNYIKEPK